MDDAGPFPLLSTGAEVSRMPKDLDALVDRLQTHDHPKFLDSMPPSQQHTCSQLLKNILRMQGYNLGLVHQVITALADCYKTTGRHTPSLGLDSDEDNEGESDKTHGTLYCIVIIKQNVYIFENVESLMPVSYVLSMSIRRYMEDHEGLDDSNAIGLYNLSQNAVLDLSDDVGDCTVTYDVLGTTGYTVPCVGIKTKTLTPSKELEILQRVLNERRLDAQRLDKRISPFLPTRDNHDKREVQDEAFADDSKTASESNNMVKTPPYEKYTYEVSHAGISTVEGVYTYHDIALRAPRYRNENFVFLSRITLFGQMGWALYHDDPVDERVVYYGFPSAESYPPCDIQYRCLAGSDAPIVNCVNGPTKRLDNQPNGKILKKAKKHKKKKKKKKKKADDNDDGHFKKASFEGSIEDSKPANDQNGIIKLTGLKSILNSKREDKIREEILSLELQHKILHYFKHINVNTTNVEKVASEYLWNENVLFDMMHKKFGVDIHSISIPAFLSDDRAREQAIKNIESRKKNKRKGSKAIKLMPT